MWVVVDLLVDIDTPKLIVPDVFSEGFYSNPNRGFIINPVGKCPVQWNVSRTFCYSNRFVSFVIMKRSLSIRFVRTVKLVGKHCSGLHPNVFLVSIILFFGTFMVQRRSSETAVSFRLWLVFKFLTVRRKNTTMIRCSGT